MTRKTFRTIPYRRRREEKTDYKKRLALVKSTKPRLVVRRTLNNIIVQIIEFGPQGDNIFVEAKANNLKEYGWDSLTGNIPSAYLTGYLAGIKAKNKGLKQTPVFDLGLQQSTKGSRIYATLKGFIDSGFDVAAGEKILPSEDRIKGSHIESYAKQLKEKDEAKYKQRFSQYIKKNVDPQAISKQFESVKQKIGESK